MQWLATCVGLTILIAPFLVIILYASMGPSIKYVTLFWINFDPLSHFVTHLGTPKVHHTSWNLPIFSRTKETQTKPLCTKSLSNKQSQFQSIYFKMYVYVYMYFCTHTYMYVCM